MQLIRSDLVDSMASDIQAFFKAEAREILDELTRGLLALEKAPRQVEIVKECFRLAHTLKGAARVVQHPQISEIAHVIEDALTPFRDGADELGSGYVTDLLSLLETIRMEINAMGRAPEAPGSRPPPFPAETTSARIETVRVEIEAMNALLAGLSEAAIQLGPLKTGADALQQIDSAISSMYYQLELDAAGAPADHARHRSAAKLGATIREIRATFADVQRDMRLALARIERELEQVQERARMMRLVPVNAIVGQLEMVARDAAATLEKQVDFEVTGGNVRLEAHVLSVVRDAVIHLIRNAIDHGIEPEAERLRMGKPTRGQVHLQVERQGERIAFLCHDDGRGMDTDALRRSAADRHVISAEQAAVIDRENALKLAFRAGVSTRQTLTEMSGRGVGLDIVHEAAVRLKGTASISSEPGAGTRVRLEVPMSLSSLSVLAVLVAGMTVLIPLDVVRGTVLVASSEIVRGAGGTFIHYQDQALPFVLLENLLSPAAQAAELKARCPAVIVQSENQPLALGVERLLGTMDALVKPLPSAAGASTMLAGAAFDSFGDPLLVIDPRGLAGAMSSSPLATIISGSAAVRPLPLLVIDDSLTTRMVEQSVLEAAGYEVHLAASGEEGLCKAKERSYGLFIVDVEMPGMSGIEFTSLTRADPVLRDVPVIIVSSLASAADRQRGTDAGASVYIVKGEFDQTFFVKRVAELARRR
jgi:two-component system chemotaxis sensor kinase CheA